MKYSVVAGKYVRALLLVAKKYNKIEEYRVLLQLLSEIYTHFSVFLSNPTEKLQKKLEVIKITFDEVLGKNSKIKYDEIFQRFVEIVFENKRQKYIPQMASLFKYAAIEVENKIPVKVVSATDLTKDEEKVLREFVQKYTNKEPVFEKEIDSSLIAGVVIEFAGKKLDVSIKGRLEKIGREVFSLRKG
ncbi:MAG: F-type H+-transporting ATPase subunit delta [Thermosipho sp. (in: thermotogales)]|nr:F-type H+-transporting ATPase subunit delta [Thermosipho sp. (in: thermotogales)]MDN5324417.1 F-type H+-transporting ATPase subunit delta [Thermosipho sp. (in: thermotogales)]